jgi:hypothetical protein
MGFTVAVLALASAAVIYWFVAAEARELARAHALAACARFGVQLLDASVALRRLRLRRGPQGLQLARRFVFEFSPDGVSRARGWIDLVGTELVGTSVPMADGDAPPPNPT